MSLSKASFILLRSFCSACEAIVPGLPLESLSFDCQSLTNDSEINQFVQDTQTRGLCFKRKSRSMVSARILNPVILYLCESLNVLWDIRNVMNHRRKYFVDYNIPFGIAVPLLLKNTYFNLGNSLMQKSVFHNKKESVVLATREFKSFCERRINKLREREIAEPFNRTYTINYYDDIWGMSSNGSCL